MSSGAAFGTGIRSALVVGMAMCCAAVAGSAGAQQFPPERLPELTTVTEISGADFHLHTIAKDVGILDKYNIKLVENLATVGGVALMPILMSGQADTSDPGVSAPIIARSTGAKIKAVAAGYVAGGDYDTSRYYVRADSDIKSAKDLEGKRIAVMSVGSTPDIGLTVWLGKNGADSSKVQRVAIPYANMVDALVNGQVDAISLVGVFYIPLEKSDNAGKVRMLFRDRDGLPTDKLFVAYNFTEDYIRKNPQTVKAFIAAIKETREWVYANREKAREVVSAHYKLPLEKLAVPEWPEHLCIDPVAGAAWANALKEVGQIKDPSQLESLTAWMTNEFNPDCKN